MDDRGGGRGYYRGGGGRHRYRGRGRGRGRGHRHQPYNNNRRYNNHGGRGRGRPGNRFGAGSFAQQDPQAAMLRQVYSFVSRVGELKNIRESEAAAGEQQGQQLRPVVATTAGNINDLVTVLCSPDKMDMLFKYQPASMPGIKAEEKIGSLGHLVISCASSLPLQTPCYAALTVAINEQIKGSQWEGFANRCVEYSMLKFLTDLDSVLGLGKNVAHAACRMKLLLRYLAILGKIGVVKGYENPPEGTPDYNKLTIFGLLSVLVQTAKVSQARKLPVTVANLLISLVLSTIPYLVEYVPQDAIAELILKPIEEMIQNYKSTFTPGTGCTSILLKGEQDDGEEMDDDDEEEEDDDDDDDDSSGQICDSLQDLLRVSKNLASGCRFALPSDSPWKGLTRRVTPNPESGETEEIQPVTYSDETMYLSVTASDALRFLLGGEGEFNFIPFSLDGIVFGRLPIFGSPPDPDDEEEEEAIKNEELEAFHKNFGLVDRFFVADVLRDCLISHETFVNDTGLQLGSPKSVAEELLSVCHLFVGENPSQGIAFALVETLFGLIVQSRNQCTLRHASLSRVLLELIRLRPQQISPALAVAMTNAFEDYMPALVPIARENISRWFAFHLTNTDYQWPAAYWQLWEPYATSKKSSSRGCFVLRTIQTMVENVTDPNDVINGCLSNTKALAEECFPPSKTPFVESTEGEPFAQFEAEIDKQVWELEENPDTLSDNIIQYEISGALAATNGRWSKTIAFVRVLVSPLKNIQKSLKSSLVKKEDDGMDQMVDDTHESKDYYIIVTDAIEKYGRTLVKIMKKEAELYGDISEGGALALRNVEEVANFNASLLQGLVACFVKNSILDGGAIVRWTLGDLGEGVTGDVIPRWWEFVSVAFQTSKPAMGGTEGGMVVDGSAAEASAAAARQKILAYATTRVCSLLATNNQKRLDPAQVDLLEGMKCVAFESKSPNIAPLVDLCSGSGGSMAVELLKSSLMQL